MAEKRQKKQAAKAFEKETFSKDKEVTGVKHIEHRQDNTFSVENQFSASEKPVSNLPRDANHGSRTGKATSGHSVQKSEFNTGTEYRKNNKKKPLLVACDVYRPAAIDQLKQIGKELNIEVYSEGKGNPVEISKNAIKYAKDNGYDYVLIDTAGRLQIDESLMDEQNYIIAKKGNTDMIEKMNTCIKKFLASDDYAKLCKKYDLSPLETK